jgi:hypothetical protein
MDAAEWEELTAFLAERGVIATRPAPEEALTNELLPSGRYSSGR